MFTIFKMPKIKLTAGNRLRSFVSEFGADIFSTDGTAGLFHKMLQLPLKRNLPFNNTLVEISMHVKFNEN